MSVEWDPKPYNKRLSKALLAGVTESMIQISNHIKVAYQRPITGKGFTDHTGSLRQSINGSANLIPNGIRGIVIAGMEYSLRVELVAGGTYAYMLPGFLEMEHTIVPTITNRARRELRI